MFIKDRIDISNFPWRNEISKKKKSFDNFTPDELKPTYNVEF